MLLLTLRFWAYLLLLDMFLKLCLYLYVMQESYLIIILNPFVQLTFAQLIVLIVILTVNLIVFLDQVNMLNLLLNVDAKLFFFKLQDQIF